MSHEAETARYLQELAQKERLVFYTELQNGNPTYTAQTAAFKGLTNEVNRHIKNLLLLALYFDRIVFYADDLLCIPFPQIVEIAHRVISSRVFQELVERRIIIFCGRGSRTREGMIAASRTLAARYRNQPFREQYDKELDRIMNRAEFVIRSPRQVAGVYFPGLFHEIYDDANPVAENDLEKRIYNITLENAYKLNHLSIVTFLDQIWFFPEIPKPVLARYFESYAFAHHRNSHAEHPSVFTFADRRNPLEREYFYQIAPCWETISNYAVSPEVFQNFLSGFLTRSEIATLLDLTTAHDTVIRLRADPSWPAFRTAYFQVLVELSRSHWENSCLLNTYAQAASNDTTGAVLGEAQHTRSAHLLPPEAPQHVGSLMASVSSTVQVAQELGKVGMSLAEPATGQGVSSPKLWLARNQFRAFVRCLKHELNRKA